MSTSRGCNVSEEFIRAQTCGRTNPFKQVRRSSVLPVHQAANRRLHHANATSERSLRSLGIAQIFSECSHMVSENIGNAYSGAIGKSYFSLVQNSRMPKTKQRTVLERAIEALADKYPRERATQVRLAQLAGVSQPTVNEWGEPDRFPSMGTAVKLATALGVCVEWLLTERGPKFAQKQTPENEELIPLLGSLADLKEDQKKQISRYVDFLKSEKS